MTVRNHEERIADPPDGWLWPPRPSGPTGRRSAGRRSAVRYGTGSDWSGSGGGIYEQVVEACDARRWPAPCACLETRGGAFRGLGAPDALMAELAARWERDALLEAGAVEPAADGSLRIADAIVGEDRILIPLRSPCCTGWTDILTSVGCLSRKRLPLLALLEDDQTRMFLERCEGCLYVAFDLADVAWLRALDLPASPAAGLTRLEARQVTSLQQALCADGPAEDAHQPQHGLAGLASELRRESRPPPGRPRRLVLVAWSPSRLSRDEPSELTVTVDFLDKLVRYAGFDGCDVDVWRPSDDEFERVAFLLRLGDPERVRQAVLDSTRDSARPLPEYAETLVETAAEPTDYLTARRRMLEAIRADRTTGTGRRQYERARRSYLDALDDHFAPVFEAALTSPDPEHGMAALEQGELRRLFHPACMQAYDELLAVDRAAAAVGGDAGHKSAGSALRDVLALAKEITKRAGRRGPRRK